MPAPEATRDWTRLTAPAGARIVVAGGAGDIGRAVVAACRANGHRVAVIDLPRSLEKHPAPEGALALPADATDAADVGRAFDEIGRVWSGIDALVFLIGFTIAPPTKIAALAPAQWDEVIAGNLRSGYLVARAALPLLERGTAPAMVMVSSGLGFNVLPGFGPYAAAKAGLVGLAKALAIEAAPAIRVNAVAPSAIETAFMRGGTGRGPDDPDAGAWFRGGDYARLFPLGRLAEVEDVVGPILFLIGPAAGFMTGQTLHINGGRITP
ncbi:MAG: SDR family oxidoreductase [Rhodospirillaceae bacterium]|nr:SDR family oxidoreductase [Rhodospirillaceae bacterium]